MRVNEKWVVYFQIGQVCLKLLNIKAKQYSVTNRIFNKNFILRLLCHLYFTFALRFWVTVSLITFLIC